MAKSKAVKGRKLSGGMYKSLRKKKAFEIAGEPTLTTLGKRREKVDRMTAGYLKHRLLSDEMANIYNPKTKKYQKAKIVTVVETPSNRHYVRRNIMTKGTIIETDLGKAKITSRPGQENAINAVLI